MKQIILITGSSSGFGELMVKTLAPKGHTIYASMRDVDGKNKEKAQELEKWAKDNNYSVHTLELDVTNDKSVGDAVKHVIGKENKIDVLVNNAGIGNFGPSEGYTIEQINKLFDVNVFGPLRLAKACLPHMRKSKSGLIIQLSSMLGRTIIPFMGLYSGTKFAVEAIFEGISDELKNSGVNVCIIEPGGYPTNFMNTMIAPEEDLMKEYGQIAEKTQKTMEGYIKFLQTKDAPQPQEVADAVLNLVEGKRPLRTVVGSTIEGTKEINKVSEKVQDELMEGFGLK